MIGARSRTGLYRVLFNTQATVATGALAATRNLAVFSAIATGYFWTGSFHEERRLLAAYGDAYRSYVGGIVPFFFGARTVFK